WKVPRRVGSRDAHRGVAPVASALPRAAGRKHCSHRCSSLSDRFRFALNTEAMPLCVSTQHRLLLLWLKADRVAISTMIRREAYCFAGAAAPPLDAPPAAAVEAPPGGGGT